VKFECQAPLHERKAPRTSVKPPIDDFLATVLAQLHMQLAARTECMI